jgi:hypothetical protein
MGRIEVISRFAYQPLQSYVIFLEKNQGTSEKRNLKKIFFFNRFHDFSPTIIIKIFWRGC